MKISDMARGVSSSLWNKKLLNVQADLIPIIRKEKIVRYIPVEPTDGIRFKGDLYGLYMYLGIEPGMHFVTGLVNGYRSSDSYSGELDPIAIPDFEYIARVLNSERVTKK